MLSDSDSDPTNFKIGSKKGDNHRSNSTGQNYYAIPPVLYDDD